MAVIIIIIKLNQMYSYAKVQWMYGRTCVCIIFCFVTWVGMFNMYYLLMCLGIIQLYSYNMWTVNLDTPVEAGEYQSPVKS